MVITTVLAAVVMVKVWNWNRLLVGAIIAVFSQSTLASSARTC